MLCYWVQLMVQENAVFILGLHLSISTWIMHSRSHSPAGEASSGAGIKPGGVESCPPSCWLCQTHWVSQSQRPHPCPQGSDSPSHRGFFLTRRPFLLCLAASISFQTLLTSERGALFPVFSGSRLVPCLSFLPDCEIWQDRICVSSLLKFNFNLHQSHILFIYMYICVYVCVCSVYTYVYSVYIYIHF